MKTFLTIGLLVFLQISLFAQQMSVKRFERNPNDLTARVTDPMRDPDGNLCAIIKVETTQVGFDFDCGISGVVNTVQKTAVIWVYVPYGIKRLTITHQLFGKLTYPIKETIEKATVYEMELITGSVETIVKQTDPVFFTFRSTPEGADVYVNNVLKGSTPCSVKLLPGKYTYRVEKVLYQPEPGIIMISGLEKDGKIEKSFTLQPAFGTIKINTLPSGATVYLDNEETGKTTPFTMTKIKSGSHRITVKKALYQPQNIEAIVTDGGTFEKTIKLTTNASNVTVNAQNDADIFIDGKLVAKGVYRGLIPSGVITFEAKKNGYYTDKKNLDIAVGDSVIIDLLPRPIIGRLEIVSTPIDAVIYLNGEKKGTTPMPLPNLMVGKYELRLEKEGYFGKLIDITIAENKTTEINETLIINQVKVVQPVTAETKNESENQEAIRTVDNSPEKSVNTPTVNPPEKQIEQSTEQLVQPPLYHADYYKYKKSKNYWLTATIGLTGIGILGYTQYASYNNQSNQTTDYYQELALSKKSKDWDKVQTYTFSAAVFSSIVFLIKAGQQSNAKKKSISFFTQPLKNGAGLNLVYKF